MDTSMVLALAAVVASAMAATASLDQSIKQVPARHRIGVVAYSAYSRATDMGTALWWYLPIAAIWAALVLAAAITGWLDNPSPARFAALGAMVAGLIGHIVVTAFWAGPTLASQRHAVGNEEKLRQIFDRFARQHLRRALIDTATLAAAIWALVTTILGN